MTDHEKLVMRNIIYAVETGGQVYGQKSAVKSNEQKCKSRIHVRQVMKSKFDG